MKKIILQFDYLNGPIWKEELDPVSGRLCTGIKVIDSDSVIQELNDAASTLYESLYSFESGSGCQFDEDRFVKIKDQLDSIVQKLIQRLTKINDGSYIVENKIDW